MPHVYYIIDTHVIHVSCFWCITHVIHTLVIHVEYMKYRYYTCIIGVELCVKQVYSLHMYFMYKATCVKQVYSLHMYYICRTICVKQVYSLHMYCKNYMCNKVYKHTHIM